MKTIALTFIIFLTLLGCERKDDGDELLLQNTFTSKKNNQDWKGITELSLTANDTLIFLGDGDGIDNGILLIKVKFEGKGSYTLENNQGMYYNTLGEDVLISQFVIQSGKQAKFLISEYDEDLKLLGGSFEIPLKATRFNGIISGDSLLLIADGRFNGKIKDGISQ